MRKTLSVLFFAICTIIPPAAIAADYYVASSGSDSNSGTISLPYATIQYGVNQLSAGDILYIRSGNYHESIIINGLNGSILSAWQSGNGWDGGWSQSGDTQLNIYNSNQSAHLRRTGTVTRTLANGISDGTLSFKWDADSLDGTGEKAIAEVYDGSWHIVWETNNAGNGSDTNGQADNMQNTGNISHHVVQERISNDININKFIVTRNRNFL